MSYANRGKGLEELVEYANKQYEAKGIALVQKISTPWNVVRKGKKIVNAYPTGKSTLDFRGTVKGGTSISFDCKETIHKKGLPLANIQDHQIEYMRSALDVGEVSFILVHMKHTGKYFIIHGDTVTRYWDMWKQNFRKRGYNFIPVSVMTEITSRNGIVLDYVPQACKC